MNSATPGTTGKEGRTRIIERPDGIYWQDEDSIEYGPFATLAEAMTDRDAALAAEVEQLEEADADGGFDVADWVDPETGEPAEESIPHIEDR